MRWNKGLTIQRDGNGSTPLHFAAGLLRAGLPESVCSVLFNTDTDALYQMDNDGLSPIDVAASVGATQAISLFVNKCPGSAGLRDAKGRTFLHVAVENKKVGTVGYAGQDPSVAWIMNMQDNEGNTALHLAVKDGSLLMFCPLFGNRKVNLNIANAKGETPLDIAKYKVPPGLFFNQVINRFLISWLFEMNRKELNCMVITFENLYGGLKYEYSLDESILLRHFNNQ